MFNRIWISVGCLAAGGVILIACWLNRWPSRASVTGSKNRPTTPMAPGVSANVASGVKAGTTGAASQTPTDAGSLQGALKEIGARAANVHFTHEVMLNKDQQAMLDQVIQDYLDGRLGPLGPLLSALGDGRAGGVYAQQAFIRRLLKSLDAMEIIARIRASGQDLTNQGRTAIRPAIDEALRDSRNFATLLQMAEDPLNSPFDRFLAEGTIIRGLGSWPEAVSQQISAMPDSEMKSLYVTAMVRDLSFSKDYEAAEAWANTLRGEFRERAFASIANAKRGDLMSAKMQEEEENLKRKAAGQTGGQ